MKDLKSQVSPLLGTPSVTPPHHAPRVQEVHLLVDLHPIAPRIAVYIGQGGAVLRQGGGNDEGLASVRHKVVARIVLDVLVVRLNLAQVDVPVVGLCLVAGLVANLGQCKPGCLGRIVTPLQWGDHLVLVAGRLGIIRGGLGSGLHRFISTLEIT